MRLEEYRCRFLNDIADNEQDHFYYHFKNDDGNDYIDPMQQY
jgi:hypothetical protein